MELAELDRTPHRCVARWQREAADMRPWSLVWLEVGQLNDCRWYVWETGPRVRPVAVHADEETARRAVQARIRELGGQWRRVPCYPTEVARATRPCFISAVPGDGARC